MKLVPGRKKRPGTVLQVQEVPGYCLSISGLPAPEQQYPIFNGCVLTLQFIKDPVLPQASGKPERSSHAHLNPSPEDAVPAASHVEPGPFSGRCTGAAGFPQDTRIQPDAVDFLDRGAEDLDAAMDTDDERFTVVENVSRIGFLVFSPRCQAEVVHLEFCLSAGLPRMGCQRNLHPRGCQAVG